MQADITLTRPSAGFIAFHPHAAAWLSSCNLMSAADCVDLAGEIVSGHPDRHVREVRLGGGIVYLKREHRVRLRDRWRNACAGFGFASLSQREALILRDLESLDLPAPRCLAHGEDGHGRAFAIINAVEGVTLRDYRGPSIAGQLGELIARIHDAGFTTPDLSAKHVLIAEDEITLIDWQRSRRARPTHRERVGALALLKATWTHASADDWQRLLEAYHRAVPNAPALADFQAAIEQQATRWLRKRNVQHQREASVTTARRLVWLDGEAVCAVAEHANEVTSIRHHLYPGNSTTSSLELPSGRRVRLVCRKLRWSLSRIIASIRGRNWRSPELCDARRLIGIESGERLLGFGQRLTWFGAESFLLTEEASA